jgi:HSP20 family protein
MSGFIRFTPPVRPASLSCDVDRFFDTLRGRVVHGENGDSFVSPRLDITENEDRYILLIDLPGLTKEDVEIAFDDGVLTLKGERAATATGDADTRIRRERWSGAFSRSLRFTLEVDAAGIIATMTDGVLRVDVPKAAGSKPVRIRVS